MKYLKKFNENIGGEKKITFTNKRNPRIEFFVYISNNGSINRIENCNINFPFKVGQRMTRNIETWACNNNFLIDYKDTCPDSKIFGIKTKDIPMGHEFRKLFPNKFK